MPDVALDPIEIESRRRERTWRLAAIELPRLRLGGSILLSIAVYVNNLFVPGTTMHGWMLVSTVVAIYAAVSWALLVVFLRRDPPHDLTVATLAGDVVVWTFAIYHSGAEASWLFFIPLLRVADQTQTTFRRALAFALFATLCFTAMLGWVVLIDQRPLAPAALAKLLFILMSGIYIALAARTAEARRARLTEAVRMSRELIRKEEEAHARAEEASAAKSEFVANMSHEMRTPLQGVIGMLQLVIEDEPSEARARRLQMARRSAEMLLSLIDDVLDFARIEARKLELQPVSFPLRQMVDDTMKALGVMAASKHLTLSYIVRPDVPELVFGDPVRLRQIVVNLVGNAVKFTKKGEISVQISRGTNEIRFEVYDTGIGIGSDVRKNIFQPFMQADTSHARHYGGAGLGLAIVARLLEAMNGAVEVKSEPGSGSMFMFRIPLTRSAAGEVPPWKSWEHALAGRLVAIVEPAEMARATIADILRGRGMFASSFAAADQVPSGRFACAVTSDSSVGVHPQVVITSPLDQKQYAVQVSWPVAERELIDAVGEALGLAAPMAVAPKDTTLHAMTSLRILLVEDNDVNREVFTDMLHRHGHNVTVASDGESALAKLADVAFDAVFMDVQLPGIDGLEVTRRFQQSGGTTPIIGLTAHTSRESIDRCLVAGMKTVLTKPVDSAQLAAALRLYTDAGEALLEIAGGNPAILERIRDAFARQTPGLLAAIRDALAGNDAAAAARHAHTLKGSLSHFSWNRGAEIAREIESAAISGDLRRAAGLLPDLENAVAALYAELARVG